MPKKPKKSPSELSSGCLSIFGLPFLLAGIFVTAIYFNGYLDWMKIQTWERTPCWITEVNLESSNDSEGGTTHKVVATYHYIHDGRSYTGNRVSMSEGSDNIGKFQRKAYHELRSHLQPSFDPSTPAGFHCYVNPGDPQQSVIYRLLRWEMQCFMAIFALTFPAVGAGLVIGGIVSNIIEKRDARLVALHPNEPWKAKSQWNGPFINNQYRPWLIALHAYTAWAALVILPLIACTAASGAYLKDPLSWLSLIFVAVWLVPAWFSLKSWRNHRSTGSTHFRPAGTPFVPGGTVEGSIVMQRMIFSRQPLEVSLICEKKLTFEGSDGDETSVDQIWEHSEAIHLDALSHEMDGYAIPVRFQLPHDAPESGKDHQDQKIEYAWRLTYKIAGSAVSGSFEIPVYRTENPPSGFAGSPSIHTTAPNSILDESLQNLAGRLKDHSIRGTFDQDNIPTSIICPRCRNPLMLIFIFFFNVVWTLAAVWLVVDHAPLIFRVIWPVTASLIWLQILMMLLHSRVVTLSSDSITVSNRIGPISWNKIFDKREISGFDHHTSTQSGTKQYYKVRLLTPSGSKCTLADNITGSSTAKALENRLMAWLEKV